MATLGLPGRTDTTAPKRSLLKYLVKLERKSLGCLSRYASQPEAPGRWSEYVFTPSAEKFSRHAVVKTIPKTVDFVLSLLDAEALAAIQEAFLKKGTVRLEDFVRIVMIQAGAYDRQNILAYMAGLVDVFSEIVPRGGKVICWRDLAELIGTHSALEAEQATTMVPAWIKALTRPAASIGTGPMVFPVYQIPGGLLMPHPTDYDPLIRDEKDPEAITKDNVRKMAFFPELEIMMRIEERTDRIVFYHPESNQSKVIRPVFELGASKNHQRTGLVSGGGGAGKSILMMKMQKNPT